MNWFWRISLSPYTGFAGGHFVLLCQQRGQNTFDFKSDLHVSDFFFIHRFFIPHVFIQVKNEMIKRWKRWKLGKDIEEEYRNTYSQTAHRKSASLNAALPPECSDTPEPAVSAPPSEESRRLVISCRNGVRLVEGISRAGLQEGTSNCSSLTEDICLEERIHNTDHAVGTEECDVWGNFDLLRFCCVPTKGIKIATYDRIGR